MPGIFQWLALLINRGHVGTLADPTSAHDNFGTAAT